MSVVACSSFSASRLSWLLPPTSCTRHIAAVALARSWYDSSRSNEQFSPGILLLPVPPIVFGATKIVDQTCELAVGSELLLPRLLISGESLRLANVADLEHVRQDRAKDETNDRGDACDDATHLPA